MSTPNPFLTLDQQLIGDIYTSTEVLDNLIVLCDDFGSRFGGSPGERQAAEFLQAKLSEYGLAPVRLEPVDYLSWQRGAVSLEIIEPVQQPVPCITLPHSPPAELEGEIIDLGDGMPGDFKRQAAHIEGKIVMASSAVRGKESRRWIHRDEKYGRSLMAGATGFIFANHYPGYGPATGGIGYGAAAPLPGLSVSFETAAFIKRLLRRHGRVKVRLTSSDTCRANVSWNVIGELPGRSRPEEIVLLGSHYDGHDIAQGATDPASGTVCVLEAARVLARHAPELARTVRFALWGIEEIGLLGSKAYVRRHAAELDRHRFYLNLDGAGYRFNDVVLNEWPALQPLFERWSREMTHDFKVDQSVHTFSDHYPFFLAGVPTGGLEPVGELSTGRGYGHTSHDTVDKVGLPTLRDTAALAARLALRLSQASDWPVQRRDAAAVQAALNSPEYQEEETYKASLRAFLVQHGLAAELC
ncbi:MAG TPA: M20/M25/M40 family metallo-hydrolase [Anaerolineae bacterium]|nr:M20/M25/M40 family metallo-hydrolase [Anaerolineae bacterium]